MMDREKRRETEIQKFEYLKNEKKHEIRKDFSF